jgi:hypothetical protein
MAIRSIERTNGTVQIAVAEDLTQKDLDFIDEALRQGARAGHVQVDLRSARHVAPPNLVNLAARLAELGATYDLAGLSRSNHRVLKLLGVAARTEEPPT